ncbi:MAG: response regulator [Armatimonadota bacterium]
MLEIRPVLFAEDSPKDAELTLAALAESHLFNKITHVKDGVQAMEYLRCQGEFSDRKSGNPAVVILDVKMPRMDGIGVLRAIRADPILDQVSVVMLTSSSEEQDLIRSYELGVNAYVLKPVKFSEFVDAVKHLGIFWAVLNEAPPEEVFVR